MTKTCQYCGNEYTPPERYIETSKFCSKRCSGKATAEKLFPEPKPRPCAHCGVEYTPSRKHVKISKFCSQKCFGLSRQDQVSKICERCGSPFSVRSFRGKTAKFCSIQCQNEGRIKPKRNRDVTVDELRQLLIYDPKTGILFWRARNDNGHFTEVWNRRWAGKQAGVEGTHGHLYVRIYNQHYAVHRIAWAMHYGEWPSRGLDHRNGKPDDNRIKNLRLANQSQNAMNTRTRSDNTSGCKGVSWISKSNKWTAYISVNKSRIELGKFFDKDLAIKARKEAEAKYHGEFARISS